MMKSLLVVSLLTVTACNAEDPVDRQADHIAGYIKKTCDEGRAVYYDSTGHSGVAIVVEAKECKNAASRPKRS